MTIIPHAHAATFTAALAADDRLHLTDIRCYLALCLYGAWHTAIALTVADLAAYLGRSQYVVYTALRRLCQFGYILRYRAPGNRRRMLTRVLPMPTAMPIGPREWGAAS